MIAYISTATIRNNGFTLIELIISMIVATIVVAFVALFLTTPVDSYLAQSRRAEMITEADVITRNINADVRNAVPNSVRFSNAGPIVIVEMLKIEDVASYRRTGSNNVIDEELDVGNADAKFRTLGPFKTINSTAYYLIVNHTGAAGHDAYALANVITPTGTMIDIKPVMPPPPASEAQVILSAPFTFALPTTTTRNVFLVLTPISYECNAGTGTLQRFEGYPITPAIAANRNAATTKATITRDVNNCGTAAAPSATAPLHQFLNWNIELARTVFNIAPAKELMQVYMQPHVENLP